MKRISSVTNSNVKNNIKSTNTIKTNDENNGSSIIKWLRDEDKVCTDGKDDGKLNAGDALKSFGKGVLGIVKSAVNHPIATGLAIAGGVALTVATGGAALPVMVAAGATIGAGEIGYGVYKYTKATTDGEAKQAMETMGNGAFALGTSAISASGALKAASNAGVSGAKVTGNIVKDTATCFKVAPEAIKVSGTNIAGNVSTLASGTITKGSNKLQGGTKGTSKATSADVKRLDLTGSQEEVITRYKDSGIFYKDGEYYIPNKWSAEEPYLAQNGTVLMKYGDDDFAVCASNIFDKSYGTTASYEAGNFKYAKASELSTDSYISATKQAKSSYVKMPEGTKVKTLEGIRTVGADEVVAIDVEGNPYVQPEATFIKKNDITGVVEPNSSRKVGTMGGVLTSAIINKN